MALKFNDTTTKQGLIQDCESKLFGSNYGTISSSTTLLQTFTRYINNAYDELVTKILNSDTRWQFDDSNYTSYPIATTNLIAGQQDYVFDDTHLKILGVYVKDASGVKRPLTPIDDRDIQQDGQSPSDFMSTDGLPLYYDKVGTSVFLYPAPSASETTLTAGLEVRFQRQPSYFTYTDTTKVPGIPSIFHRYLSLRASFDYAVDNDLDKARNLKTLVDEMNQEVQDWFNKRDKDDKPRLQARKTNFK